MITIQRLFDKLEYIHIFKFTSDLNAGQVVIFN